MSSGASHRALVYASRLGVPVRVVAQVHTDGRLKKYLYTYNGLYQVCPGRATSSGSLPPVYVSLLRETDRHRDGEEGGGIETRAC